MASRVTKKRRRIRTLLIKHEGPICKLCNQPINLTITDPTDPRSITVDHKKPLIFGGKDTRDNLQLAHRACNMERGVKEWLIHVGQSHKFKPRAHLLI